MVNETAIECARRIKHKTKDLALEQLQGILKEKPLYGQYPKRLHDNDVNDIETYKWLSTSGLKSETEEFIIAAQDQCLKTNYCRHKILKDGTSPMCRICSKQQETIDHLVSRCSELAKTEYTQRHNRTAAYIHWRFCKHYNIKVTNKYYEHENNETTILWDMPIQTDRKIKGNRPDIIVKDKNQRTCQLIEISVPTERNTSIKTTEKLSKYEDLEIEIEKMWDMNTMTIPIIIGALGLSGKKGMKKYINKIPASISIQETQKCVLLGTAHILRRILSIK